MMLDELVASGTILSGIFDKVREPSNHADISVAARIATMREGLLRHKRQTTDCAHLLRSLDQVVKPGKALSALPRFPGANDDRELHAHAENVLGRVLIHSPFDLSVAIWPPFNETIRLLGYPV